MELKFAMALDDSAIEPGEDDEALRVWVLYENASLCNRALMLLHRATYRIQSAGQLVCAITRLDALEDSRLVKALSHEASLADVVVVATHDDRELPRAFKDWIRVWRSATGARPTALAVVLDAGESPQGAAGVSSQLAEVARLGGLDFFATGDAEFSPAIEERSSFPFAGRKRSATAAWLQLTSPDWRGNPT